MNRRPLKERLSVFVPCGATDVLKGSAVVGTESADRSFAVDFEGNVWDADNLQTFEQRLTVAAWRHADYAPTRARTHVRPNEWSCVGETMYDPVLSAWVLDDLWEPEALAEWITPETVPEIGGSLDLKKHAAGLWWSKLSTASQMRIQGASKYSGAPFVEAVLQEARQKMAQDNIYAGHAPTPGS